MAPSVGPASLRRVGVAMTLADVVDVVAVVHDGVQGLDLVGPVDVFAGANAVLGVSAYRLLVCGPQERIAVRAGLRLMVEPLPASVGEATVLVPGSLVAAEGSVATTPVTEWLARTQPHRLATVCTGAFLAARAGRLDGRRVTTHWSEAERLAREHPEVRVTGRELYVRDGPVWSSGGVTAGIDMALAMVSSDHGDDVARTVSRWLVMHLHRPGWQDQYAGPVWHRPGTDARVNRVRAHVESDPAADHGIDAVARRAGLSARHLQRVFRREVGVPLSTFVTRTRLDAAKNALVCSDATLPVIARSTGFGSAESLRRAFQKHLGVPPHEYRARFGAVKEEENP